MTSYFQYFWASLVAQTVKNLPAAQESWVRSLGWKHPLEKGTHCSILAWRIPRTEEPSGLQSIGWQRVWPDWATFTFTFILLLFLNYLFILLYTTVLVLPYIDMNPPWVHMCSHPEPLLTPSSSHLSGSSRHTSPRHPVSCIKPRLVIHFTHDNLHVLMSLSHLPLALSQWSQKTVQYICVSLAVSHTGLSLPSYIW